MPAASVDLIYIDPPFNTGKVQGRTQIKTARSADRRPHGFRGPALRDDQGRHPVLCRPVRRLPGIPRTAPGRGVPRAGAPRQPVLPHRLSRGALLQGAAGHHLRPRLLPERDHLGLRLRRPAQEPLAAQARQHPALRQRPGELHLQLRRDRAHPVHGARPGRAGEGGARQAADRHLVAHDRPDQRQGEDRLSDAEAAGHPAPHRAGLVAARRPGAGFLRRQRHDRRGLPRARPAFHPGRRQPAGHRGDGAALCRCCRHRMDRVRIGSTDDDDDDE